MTSDPEILAAQVAKMLIDSGNFDTIRRWDLGVYKDYPQGWFPHAEIVVASDLERTETTGGYITTLRAYIRFDVKIQADGDPIDAVSYPGLYISNTFKAVADYVDSAVGFLEEHSGLDAFVWDSSTKVVRKTRIAQTLYGYDNRDQKGVSYEEFGIITLEIEYQGPRT